MLHYLKILKRFIEIATSHINGILKNLNKNYNCESLDRKLNKKRDDHKEDRKSLYRNRRIVIMK